MDPISNHPQSLDQAGPEQGSPPRGAMAGLRRMMGRVLPLHKGTVIGVDLCRDAIRLAKIRHTADTRHTLTDYADVPLPPDSAPQGEALAEFLGSTLNSFCADAPQAEIWTAISSSQVDTRYLRVPKVPQRQLAKAVYWTYRRSAPFDETGALFGFDVIGELSESGVRKYEVMAYTVPRAEISAIRDLFKNSGHPLTGLTIIPFCLQNLMQTHWLGVADQSVCTLYIGRDFSRIDIFEGSHLVLSRVIKAGVQSMLDALKEDLSDRRQGSDPINLDQLISVEQLSGSERQDQSFFHLLAQRLSMREEEIFSMILPAMDRLIGQVERTLKHYALHFDNKAVSHLYLFGEVSIHKRIADLIADQFGIRSQTIDLFGISNLRLAVPAPPLRTERNHLIPVMALALSNNRITPDFLLTHEDKMHMRRIHWTNRALAGVLALSLLIITGFSFSQKHRIQVAEMQIAALQQTLERQTPTIDRHLLTELARQTQARAQEAKLAAGKYLPMAILSELSALTSDQIRLLQVEADLTDQPAGQKKGSAPVALKIKGFISGDRLSLDVGLAGYIVNLRTSPLFSHAVIKERTLKRDKNGQVLHFTIHLGLER